MKRIAAFGFGCLASAAIIIEGAASATAVQQVTVAPAAGQTLIGTPGVDEIGTGSSGKGFSGSGNNDPLNKIPG